MHDTGSVIIDLDRVVAIEQGKWCSGHNDWLAVAVFDGGGRLSLERMTRKELQFRMEDKPIPWSGKPFRADVKGSKASERKFLAVLKAR